MSDAPIRLRREVKPPQGAAVWYVRVTGRHDATSRANEWHVEGPDVDHMLCGLRIEADDGEVRTRPPLRNVCARCDLRLRAR